MAKPRVKLDDSYKRPFLAAGRIIRELEALTPKGRETALQMVSEYKFNPPEPTAEDRTGDLFEAGS